MQEITPDNAAAYVLEHRLAVTPVTVTPLAWGVSNVVLRIESGDGDAFVLKQSREQLRTAAPWFSRLDRVWREVAVMRLLGTILPPGVVPAVRHEDRDNYLFTMEAAPAEHVVWKQALLEGRADPNIAERLGEILATVHRETHPVPQPSPGDVDLGDTEVFDQLRIDPFYRRIAERHPDLRPPIEAMLAEREASKLCLVLADFSPKNVLVHGEGLTLVDFETGHYGDPAFDLGFFLSHLLLKTLRHARIAELTEAFWSRYWPTLEAKPLPPGMQRAELFRRTLPHLAGCMLARVDGTSPVDYLTPEQADRVRWFSRSMFLDLPADWADVQSRLVM